MFEYLCKSLIKGLPGKLPPYRLTTAVRWKSKASKCDQPEPDPRVTHAILGVEGVIINSMEVTYKAHQRYCKSWGKDLCIGIYSDVMGLREVDAARIIINKLGLQFVYTSMSAEMYVHGVYQNILARTSKCPLELIPGIDEFLRTLYKKGVLIGLATSLNANTFRALVEPGFPEISKYISLYVCGDDPCTTVYKKDFSVYKIAAGRFCIRPETQCNVLAIESSRNLVREAVELGMKVACINPCAELEDGSCQAATNVCSLDLNKLGV